MGSDNIGWSTQKRPGLGAGRDYCVKIELNSALMSYSKKILDLTGDIVDILFLFE